MVCGKSIELAHGMHRPSCNGGGGVSSTFVGYHDEHLGGRHRHLHRHQPL